MADLWIRAAKNVKDTDKKPNDILEGLQNQQVLQDILEQIKQQSQLCLKRRWKIKGFSGRELVVRDLCAKIVNWVNYFAQVGDVATQWDPGHAAIPWAVFRFVLLLCSSDIEAFEAMLEGFEKTSSIIYRGNIVEKVYLSLPERNDDQKALEEAIVKLYTSVLEYLMTAKNYFETNSGKRILYSVLRPSGMNHVLQKMADQEINVEKFARLLDAQRQSDLASTVPSLKSSLDTLDQTINGLTSTQAGWQRLLISSFGRSVNQLDTLFADLHLDKKILILRWLSTLPYHLHHRNFVKDLIPGSGKWLLSNSAYMEFYSSSSSDIFWLRGFSGCGKTRLAATVIETIKLDQKNIPDPAPVAYFYCSNDPAEPDRADLSQILRALVKQLSQSTPDGPLFQTTRDAFDRKEAETAENGLKPSALTVEECADLLHQLSLAAPITIVLDAIDECDPTERHNLFRIFRDLIANSTNVVKIFLTSRMEDDIVTALNQSNGLTVVAEYNSADIASFVKVRVSEAIQESRLLPGVDPSKFEKKVIESLTANSQGMFQWANLQLAALCDRKKVKVLGDVIEALEHSPKTLMKAYSVLYEQVCDLERNGRMIASKILSWLLYGQRMLSVEEILAVLTNDRDFADSTWFQDLTIDTIVSCCCTMVVVDEQLNVLRFAHPSVREFLELLDDFDQGRIHLCIAQRCLDSYLFKPDCDRKDKLSSYSSVYWPVHCEKVSERESIREQLLEFLYDKEHFHDSLDDMQRSLEGFDETSNLYKKLQATISDPVTPLFAISCFGLVEALEETQIIGQDINQPNTHGASCLYLAARWGYASVVEYLLDHGANIDAAGGVFGSALQAASFAGHIEIVKVLLSRGASAFRLGEFPNAIQAALAGGYESIATLLLDVGYKGRKTVDLDTVLNFALVEGNLDIVKSLMQREHVLETRLQIALSKGKERESKRLLEEISDINTEEGLFGNALQAAVFGKSLTLVRVILEKGAQVDLRGRFGTALRLAAVTGQANIARHLLAKGADCNVKDESLGDCLQGAAAKNHTELIQLLLDKKADPDGQHGFFGNPLQAASFYGHRAAAELLLKAGAMIGLSGRFPDALHAAIHGNQPDIIQLLLANGAKVTAREMSKMKACSVSRNPRKPLPHLQMYSSLGYTSWLIDPLQAASVNGNLLMIRTLLSNGVKEDATSSARQFSALQIATFKGFNEIVTLLLEHGADVNVVGKVFGSALHAAIASSNLLLAELLLAKGANIDIHWRKFGSPLQVACERGDLEAAKFLCDSGANVNNLGGKNGTALQVAAYAGHLEIVRFLIAKNADINHPGGDNGSALQAASTKGFTQVIKLLVEYGADIEAIGQLDGAALYCASAAGNTDAVTLLLQQGANVNVRKENMAPALHIATLLKRESTVRALLDSGADIYLQGMLPKPYSWNIYESNYWQKSLGPLYIASMKGHLELSKMILHKSLYKFIDDGSLIEAVKVAAHNNNNKDLPSALMELGLGANMSIGQFKESMILACSCGNLELVKFFLKADIDPNIVAKPEGLRHPFSSSVFDKPAMQLLRDDIDKTPLHASTIYGHREIVQVLIDARADVNALNSTGVSPLDTAIYSTKCNSSYKVTGSMEDKMETIRILIEAGADLAHLDSDSLSVLRENIVQHCDLVLFKTLVVRGSVMEPHSLPIYEELIVSAVEHNRKDVLLYILDFQPPEGFKRVALHTSLTFAAKKGLHEIFATLIDRFLGTDDIVQDPLSDLLVQASTDGHSDIVNHLLLTVQYTPPNILAQALKASLDARTIEHILHHINQTVENTKCEPSINIEAALGHCLRQAIRRNKSRDLLKSLTRWGADVNFQDEEGESALSLAIYWETIYESTHKNTDSGNDSTLSFLLRHGANPNIRGTKLGTPLIAAAAKGSIESVRLLLEAGADPNTQVEAHGTALTVAAACSSHKLWKNFPEDTRDCEEYLFSTLDRAKKALLTTLLQYGALVNTEPEDLGPWGSALQAAAYHGHVRSVELLLDHGADINAKGGVMGSPMAAAAYKGEIQTIKVLIKRGADLNVTGGFYGSVLRAAKADDRWEYKTHLVAILQAMGAQMGEAGEGEESETPNLPHYW